MSLEPLLDLIRHRFSPSEGQTLVRSLQQDPLVWRFVKDEETSLPYFESEGHSLSAFSPGRIAAWLIAKATETSFQDLLLADNSLPSQVQEQAEKAFSTVTNTGLPPADLMTAGMLALTIRDRRLRKGSWDGVSDELLNKGNQHDIQKNFQVWRTPTACLYALCSDFDDFVVDFFTTNNGTTIEKVLPIFIHTFIANPIEHDFLQEQLFSFAQNLPIDIQLASLKWLESFGKAEIRQTLAKNLIQTRIIVDAFARTFSELQAFETNTDGVDPLDKQIRYTLPEDVNRLAAFHYYCDNKEKAAETYQKSSDILDFINAQTLFQSLSSKKDRIPHTRWLEIIKTVPNSKKVRFFYIQSLLKDQKDAEASKQLESLPDSHEKALLDLQIKHGKGPLADFDTSMVDNLKIPTNEIAPPTLNYFVHKTEVDLVKETLKSYLHTEDQNSNLQWVENVLEENFHDSEMIQIARDIYEFNHRFDKAIELTSFLERTKPEVKDHQRTLARLYCAAGRWQDAFTTLQSLMKSDSAQNTNDLERFAEASLKTSRIDMAISICQNILKQEPNNTKALVLLGESYMEKGDVVKSIQHMEQVVEMLPEEPITWLTLSRLWRIQNQHDRSFEILNKAAAALPNNPSIMRELGKAYLERKSPSDAVAYLKKAFDLEPKNIEGKLDLAQAEFQLGQYQEAYPLLEPFMQNYENDPAAARLLGHVLYAMEKKHEAEPVLISAANHFPEDEETVLLAARLVLTRAETSHEGVEDGRLDSIQTILENALGKIQNNQQIRLHLADIDRLKGNHQQALDAYTVLAEDGYQGESAANWRLPYGLGKSAIALENLDIGLAALKEASNKQPENMLVLHALAEAYQSADLHGKAQTTAKSALLMAQEDIDNILWYAKFKINSNEPIEAVKAFKEAIRINPDSAALKLWLTKTLITIGSQEEAKETIGDIINNDAATSNELHQTAYIAVHLNDINLATQAFEKSIQNAENSDPIARMDLAICYQLLDQRRKALEILNVSDQQLADCPQLAILKSDVLTNVGQYETALNSLKSIEKVVESKLHNDHDKESIKEQSPLLYTYDFTLKGYYSRLGQLSRVLGDIESAYAHLSHALDLEPADVKLRNALMETTMSGFNFDRALEIAGNEFENQHSTNEMGHDHLDLICSQAEILIDQENYDGAAALFEELTSNDTHPRVFAVQSRLAAGRGENDRAQNHFNQAITSYQKEFDKERSLSLETLFRQIKTLSSIADAALALGDYQSTINKHQEIWTKLNNQPYENWRYLLALTKAAEVQQIADALSIKTHSPGAEILSEANFNISQTLFESLDNHLPEEQLRCLKARTVSAFSGEWPLSLNADACLNGSEDAAAVVLGSDNEDLIGDILESYPNSPRVLQAYGIYALRSNKSDGATHVAKALAMDTSNPINHALLAMLNTNEPEQAIKSIETALQFWPDEPEWHIFAADLNNTVGNTEPAAQHISQAVNIQPENGKYWQKSAEMKINNNQLAQAKGDLEKSASYQSVNPSIWLSMADVNRRLGNLTEATNNLHTARELEPKNVTIAAQEVKFLLAQNKNKEAENKANEVLHNIAESEEVRVLLAQAQAKQGKFEDALYSLASSMEKNPQSSKLKLESIKIRKEREGVETVLPELVELAHNNPNDPTILTTLTDWLIQTNRLKIAEETAQTILRIIPQQAEVHLMLGRLQRKNGQLDQAIAHLSDAIQLDSTLIEAYIELGKTYQERRDLEKAISVFQKGSLANASDPRPYYYAGMALKECKDYSGAEAMLKQAKRYSPDDPNISRQLGVITALNLINNLRETR